MLFGVLLYTQQLVVVVRIHRIIDNVEASEQAINILMLQVVGVSQDTAAGLLHHIVLVHVQPFEPTGVHTLQLNEHFSLRLVL